MAGESNTFTFTGESNTFTFTFTVTVTVNPKTQANTTDVGAETTSLNDGEGSVKGDGVEKHGETAKCDDDVAAEGVSSSVQVVCSRKSEAEKEKEVDDGVNESPEEKDAATEKSDDVAAMSSSSIKAVSATKKRRRKRKKRKNKAECDDDVAAEGGSSSVLCSRKSEAEKEKEVDDGVNKSPEEKDAETEKSDNVAAMSSSSVQFDYERNKRGRKSLAEKKTEEEEDLRKTLDDGGSESSEELQDWEYWLTWFKQLEATIIREYSKKEAFDVSPTGTGVLGVVPTKTLNMKERAVRKLQIGLKLLPESTEEPETSRLRGEIHYYWGKLLNIFPGLDGEAQENLERALELSQTADHRMKVLVCLSFCDSKRNQLGAAREKLNQAFNLGDPSKDVLVDLALIKAQIVLSILKGELYFKNENMEALCRDIIDHAKKAIPMDMVGWYKDITQTLDSKDHSLAIGLGTAHYCHGVGHLLSWLVGGCKHGKKLSNAISEFKKVGQFRLNPRYMYMCAMASKWFGDYSSADFAFRALKVRVECPATDIDAETSWLSRVCRELATPEGSISVVQRTQESSTHCLDCLKLGANEKQKIVCRAQGLVKAENGISWYSVVDNNGVVFTLLIYGVREYAIRGGERLVLNAPYLHENKVQVEEGMIRFKLVFLGSTDHLLVNGRQLGREEKMDVTISPPSFI